MSIAIVSALLSNMTSYYHVQKFVQKRQVVVAHDDTGDKLTTETARLASHDTVYRLYNVNY